MVARLCLLVVVALLSACSTTLATPESISPQNGANFHHFPRTTELRWKPVEGAASYSVEVDCFHCCEIGKWCSEVGVKKLSASGVKTTSYKFDWVGMNLGRWRVWAVAQDGSEGPKSVWQDFYFSQ